jgi:hypothetical protein
MRQMFAVLAVSMLCGGGLLAAPSAAAAGPGLIALPTATVSMVEPVDFARRFYRRNGYYPGAAPVIVGAPPVVVTAPPVVVEGAPVIVEVPLAPLRPLSCGEFRFWNGEACIDARYNKVNVGPR